MFFINELQNKYGELHWWDFNDTAIYKYGSKQNNVIKLINNCSLSTISVTSSNSRSLFLTYNPTSPSSLTDVMLYMIGDFDFTKILRIFRSTNHSNSICIDNYNSTIILNDTDGTDGTNILVIRERNNGLRNIQIFNSSQNHQSQSLTTDGNNLASAFEGYVWFGAEPISNPLNPTNGKNFSNTIIKELIMVPTYLSDNEMNQIVFYLKNKWKV